MKTKNIAVLAAAAFIFASSTAGAFYRCNQRLAVQCRTEWIQCIVATGGDEDGACEGNYNQCLLSVGCPIP